MAMAELAKRLLRGEQGLQRDENIGLGAILNAYQEHKAASLRANTFALVQSRLGQALDLIGDRPARTLKPSHWREYMAALKAAGDKPDTINKKVSYLRAAFSYAAKTGEWHGENPLAHVEKLSDPTPPAWRWLRADEIERLLTFLKDGGPKEIKRSNGRNYTRHIPPPRGLYGLVLLLLNTGMRKGEALALKWADVDMDNRHIRVTTAKKAARGRKAEHRFVPVNEALGEFLGAIGPSAPDDPVIAISQNNLRRKFAQACKDAGIDGHVRVHDLRHTCASHLAQSGTPLNTIREILGHSTMTMTLRYAHLCPSVKADAMASLNFGGAAKTARIMAVSE